MSEDVITRLKENVIEGRITAEDDGVYGDLAGTPGVVELTREAIDANIPLEAIINNGLSAGMEVVGEKFSKKEYFIPDMLASAEAVGAAMDIIKPLLEASDIKTKGKFVIATVKGDLHDIGKNIVSILVKGAGYDVIDMGIDVPSERIVELIKEEKPEYLGLSALLTTTMLEMDTVIKALEENNLRDDVKVMVGGAAVSDEYAKEIGADAYCVDAIQAIKTLDAFAASEPVRI
jgi:5-methyltetrahydrofolate--homocysteine methyltransferase